MNTQICSNCGSPLVPGSAFCEKCGAPIGGGSIQPNPVPVTPPSMTYQNAPVAAQPGKNGKAWPYIIVIALVIVVIAIVMVLAMKGCKSTGAGNGSSMQTQGSSTSVFENSSGGSSSSSSYSAPVFTSVETSSVLAPDRTTSDYGGSNVLDGISQTAWNEGAYGDGTGEWLELSASSPQRVSSVSIMGGYPKPYRDGSDVYYKNNRPRQITISYDGGSQTFYMEDLREQFQTFTLSIPVETIFVRITINSVYKGTDFDDCCIAEVIVS